MTFNLQRLTRTRIALLGLLLTSVGGAAVYAAFQSATPVPQLSAYAPSGALLAIESPDFAALLKSWNSSAEQRRWLAGANYSGFANSRLFGRLGDAQKDFTAAAGLPADTAFLQQVAGNQSLFAWYDIGNLEFLYITHLPPGVAANTPLLKLRDNFEIRKAGDTTFYVRTSTPANAPNDTDASTSSTTARTVAFAVRGDYLMLATREDLLANALQLMQQTNSEAGQPGSNDARSLQHDRWYAASIAAAGRKPGDLRMTLNLEAIVPSPYFRTYWIQRNITALSQYSAALSDLYRSGDNIREDRVLIPSGDDEPPAELDLAPVLAYLPADLGVYRATAQPKFDDVLSQLASKVLTRDPASYSDPHDAPQASLTTPSSGDAENFDDRIDEPLVPTQSPSAVLASLQAILPTTPPTAMLTLSTATTSSQASVFAPIHTAVVLAAATPWDATALQQSLTTALAPQLSASTAALTFTPQHNATASWFTLSGNAGFAFAVQGNICILASDESTLLQLLAAAANAPHTAHVATTIAGVAMRTEQPPLLALAKTLDHATTVPAAGAQPAFFSGNMASLSQTFQDLDSEIFTESLAPNNVIHQTVVYQWHH